MTIWLLRFVPYAGAAPIDGYFRDEARARAWYDSLRNGAVMADFTDDYGVAISYDPRQGALVLTNTDVSARAQKELNEANHDAARRVGMVPKIAVGSTVQ